MEGTRLRLGTEGRLERLYLEWPARLVEVFREASRASPGRVGGLVVGCGMGGSAYSVEAAATLLESRGVPVVVVRDYEPPGFVGPSTLVVAVSFSGETAETLHCAVRSRSRGARLAVVAGESSRLERLALEWGAPLYRVPRVGAARTSLATLVGGLLGLLDPGLEGVVETIAGALDPAAAAEAAERVVEKLLAWRGERRIIVAACGRLGSVARRWRSELAEYAGLDVQGEVYPEAGHNSVSTWESGCMSRRALILVKHSTDPLCARIEETLIERHCDGNTVIVDVSRQARVHPLAGILQASMVAGLAGVKLAEATGRDPLDTPEIKRFRRMVWSVLGDRL